MVEDAVRLVNMLLAASLVGNELGTWAVVHPALHKLSFDREVPAPALDSPLSEGGP